MSDGPRGWRNRALYGAIAAVLSVGIVTSVVSARYEGERMRAEFFVKAHLVKEAINIDRIAALSGSEADLKNQDYIRLKKQLTRVRHADPQCRFQYLMGMRPDGSVFFFVDSEDESSKDYSPPGQVYTEVTEAYRNVFFTGKPIIEGPVTDRWGSWISALIPIRDPKTQKILAVFGMDIDARNWTASIFYHSLFPVSVSIFASTLIAFFLYARRRDKLVTRRLADIIEFLPDAIFATDLQGRVIMWNRAIEEMTGIKKEEMLGKGEHLYTVPFYGERRRHLLDLIDSDDEELKAKYDNVERKGRTLQAEVFTPALYGGKGAYVWAVAAPLFDIHEKRIGAIESIRDVTEWKNKEREKEKLQLQLLQSQKMEAIGTMANGIAHNFNNILGSMMGYADMALDGVAKDSRTHCDITHIKDGIVKAHELANQMLSFSRKRETQFKKVKISSVVKESIEMFRMSAPSSLNIVTRIEVDEENTECLADQNQIQQVILNLCNNGLYAIKDGKGTIELGITEAEISLQGVSPMEAIKPGSYVHLTVKDTGCGMDDETLKHIFEPFFTTKEVGKGTGLGLPIVHGIIEAHGGGIVVTSQKGKGTTINIYLPKATK